MLTAQNPRGFLTSFQNGPSGSNLVKRYPKPQKPILNKKKKKKKVKKNPKSKSVVPIVGKKISKNLVNSTKHNLVNLQGQKNLKLQPLPLIRLNTAPQISRSLQIWQKAGGDIDMSSSNQLSNSLSPNSPEMNLNSSFLLNSALMKPMVGDSFLNQQIQLTSPPQKFKNSAQQPLLNDPRFHNQLKHFISKNQESLPFMKTSSNKKSKNKSQGSVLTGIFPSLSNASYESKVIMEARRKLTQTNQMGLLSALDLSNSPSTPQLTPETRQNALKSLYNNSQNGGSLFNMSSLVKTPQYDQYMSYDQQIGFQAQKKSNFLDLVSPNNNNQIGQVMKANEPENKKTQQKNEMKFMLEELVEEQKLSKRKLAEMIFEVMNDTPDAVKQEKTIKLLVKTLLKSGSLIPKALDPEQIMLIHRVASSEFIKSWKVKFLWDNQKNKFEVGGKSDYNQKDSF